MEPILKTIVWGIVKPFVLWVLMMLPVFLMIWRLAKVKKRYMSESEEPFTGIPRRPPGESLRIKIQHLDENFGQNLLVMVLFPGALALIVLINPIYQTWLWLAVLVLMSLSVAIWFGLRAMKLLRELWDYSLGFTGERVVGEELNQLMLDGYRVFHDVQFEGFNIDHVVVGPPGVYAIETKARRKPKGERGKKEYHVRFDGVALHWPKKQETEEIEQAALNARTLGQWLTSATGETVTASPVLVIPGWYVDRMGKGMVNVLNEKEVRYSFPARPSNPLPPEQIQRIVHQLNEKCRLPKE